MGVRGNERADASARIANRCINNRIYFGPSMKDFRKMVLDGDRAAWRKKLWPFSERDLTSRRYFTRVEHGSPVPGPRD